MSGTRLVGDVMTSNKGMSSLSADEFESELLSHISPYLAPDVSNVPVVICGMAGARSGWTDAGYVAMPLDVAGLSAFAVEAPCDDPRLDVRILSGISQQSPPDVMRGEETQLVGLINHNPYFEGEVCLPGTHSKWVSLRDKHVSRARTSMTGEIFGLMRDQSILRLSVAAKDNAFPMASFLEGVEKGNKAPDRLLSLLFQIRAGDVLGQSQSHEHRLAALSGLLIGTEFASEAPDRSDTPIAIIGTSNLARLYMRAAGHLGYDAKVYDGEELVKAGLIEAKRILFPEDDAKEA